METPVAYYAMALEAALCPVRLDVPLEPVFFP